MSDYSALAQRVSASASGIRGCLLLNRDGLVLGADREDAESHVKAAWIRFAAIGDPDRSYVEFPDQIWGYVRRGSYAAFAVADVGVRPGVLVDLLEQALIAAEQDRAHERDTMRVPDVPAAPSGKPRTSLHMPAAASEPRAVPVEVIVAEAGEVVDVERPPPSDGRSDQPSGDAGRSVGDPPPPPAAADPSLAADGADAPVDPEDTEPVPQAGIDGATPREAGDDDAEVDRILLAKEFAGLLQVPKEDDDTSR